MPQQHAGGQGKPGGGTEAKCPSLCKGPPTSQVFACPTLYFYLCVKGVVTAMVPEAHTQQKN